MVRSVTQLSLQALGGLGAALFAVIVASAQPAAAEPRVALVIGNSAYKGDLPALPNPENDAKLMARTLKSVGFDVIDIENASQSDLKKAILDFGNRLSAAGRDATGLVFYAGHGVQVNGENYLIPVDAQIKKEADVDLAAVTLSSIQSQMQFADNAVNIIILDACRNNPLKASSRGMKRGLAEIDAANGTFIAYSTAPGQTAADGNDFNSPYTKALAEKITEPGVSISDVFQEVRTQVLAETGNQQRPWDSSSLTGRFYFKASDATQQVASAQPVPSSTTDNSQVRSTEPTTPAAAATQGNGASNADVDELATEKSYWDSVKDSNDPDEVSLYLKKYPNGYFTDLANDRLAKLKATQTASAAPSAQPAAASDNSIDHSASAPAQPTQQAALAPQVAIVALNQTVYAKNDGRVRAAPDGKADIITQFPPNAEITATGQTSDRKWWRVALADGRVGYMHKSVVSEQPFQTAAAAPAAEQQAAPAADPNAVVMVAGAPPAQTSSNNPAIDAQQAQQLVSAAQNPQAAFQAAAAGALSQLFGAGGGGGNSQPAAQPQMNFVAYNHTVTVRAGARVLNAPGAGQAIAQITQQTQLGAQARTTDASWYQVVLPNGSLGYISRNYVQQ